MKKIISLIIFYLFFAATAFAQSKQAAPVDVLFKSGQSSQKSLNWKFSLSKFQQVIAAYPKTEYAQKAYIEIGKYYKYNRDWETAINYYRKSMAIIPGSRSAHDAWTAEAAIYYFRQDFQRALEIFQSVLSETKDWDQIKYCTYWIKELKRKMDFNEEESFACGPEAMKIACKILGIDTNKNELKALYAEKDKKVSLSEMAKFASIKGMNPKVVKISTGEIQNLDTPFIALINPEHYVVVTDTHNEKVKYIDPANQKDYQTNGLEEFGNNFKGYALVFLEDRKFAKANYILPSAEELKEVKGVVCWCCPPSALGGVENNPNVEFDGKPPCGVGMPSWQVNTANLNFIVQDMDLSYSARGMPVQFIRTYNGDDPREGIFGRSWTFNYNISLTENPDRSVDVRRGDAKVDHFFWNGTRLQGPYTVYDTLTKNADGTYSLKIKKDKTVQNFSSTGKLINIKDRNDNTLSFAYDGEGKLTTITDPNNKNISFTYGANNKVSRITLADGRYATFVYDANNNLIQSVDLVRATSSFTYDSASYISSITTPYQGTTTIVNSTSGEGHALKSITNSLGHKREYGTYQSHYQVRVLDALMHPVIYSTNSSGYTSAVTSATGVKVTFEYDAQGNRTKIKDAAGNATSLVYDGRGNVVLMTDALSNRTIVYYDDNDNAVSLTDSKGNIYNFTYNGKGNLLTAQDADNQASSFAYNSYGQLSRIDDAKGGINNFEYDAEGNLTKHVSPAGKNYVYRHDTLGRLTGFTDPKGNSFSYSYDGVDHLVKVFNPDQTEVNYTYSCCKLNQVQDAKGTLSFTYDGIGRPMSFTNYDNKVISYVYDKAGNLTSLTYPDSKVVAYVYDADNRLTKVTDWLNNVTQYNYGQDGNLSSSASPGLLTIYKYDELGQLKKLINYNSMNNAIVSGFEFTNDSVGNRTRTKKYLPLSDPIFNLANANYNYNNENQLSALNGGVFTYDDSGNMLSGVTQGAGAMQLTYNYNNQLVNYAGSGNFGYTYDALGSRISKVANGVTTKYIVDPNQNLPGVLAEADTAGNISAYYVYGLGLISKIEGNNAYFYQYDGLGSTVAISDRTGAVKNKYAYDEFGNLAINSSEEIGNTFKYVGKYGVMTDAPDLLYMRARYYIPSMGRFINKDPIGLAGEMNLYGYVGGNPLISIDPDGLSWRDIDPNYGNWGGNNRGGGGYVCNGGLGNMGTPGIDSMDDLFKIHDYGSFIGDPLADSNLAKALRDLPRDPRKWERPSPNVGRAIRYRFLAELWFG